MQELILKLKSNKVIFVNILFTLFSILINLSNGIKLAWITMWILVPLLLCCEDAFYCVTYMSLYMRVQPSVTLFAILICISFTIILIKKILYLNKNKLLNKYLKFLLYYSILIILPLFYSILVNKSLNISFVYYLNLINLLFLFYLLKNNLNKNIILLYCYGLIVSSILSLICYVGGLHYSPFGGLNRFSAFMPLCNTLGACCVICVALLYVMYINKKISFKQTFALIVILSLIGVVTFSKTFVIAFAVVLIAILVNQFKISNNKSQFVKITLLLLLALSPLILYYGIIMGQRFFINHQYPNIIDTLTTGRLEKWLIYLKPWSKHLYSILFGLGLGFDFNTPYSSHSFYVGYLAKLGIVGLTLLLGFMYIILFKNKTKIKLKYFPIIIVLLICVVEDMSYNTFNFVPFIIGLFSTTSICEGS